MKNWKSLLSMVLVVGILLACSMLAMGAEQPRFGGTLRFAIGAPAVGMAPGKSTASIIDTVTRGIYENLVDRDVEGNFVPVLAESWSVSDDNLVWTFRLRKGVRFHDGHEMTAADVKASFDRMLNPEYELPLSSVLKPIASVKIVDDYTVNLITEKPVADMMPRLAWAHAVVVSKNVIEEYGADIDWHPVGTGPYKYDSHVPGESITLVRFDDYWEGRPYLDKIEFLTVTEDATRVAMLQAGEADIIVNIPSADVPRLTADSGINLRLDPSTRVAHIGINCQKPPFDNPRVRQALNYAIDKDALVKGVMKGVGEPAYSIVSPIVWGHYADRRYSYDPNRARALLAEAGYPDGFNVTLSTPQGRYAMDKETSVAVQDMLAEIGLNVDAQVVDWTTYLSRLTTPLDTNDIELYMLGWESGTGDIGYILDLIISSESWPQNGWNTMFYKNKAVDTLIEASRYTVDLADRYEIVSGLQKLVMDDAPWIFLYVYQMTSASSSKVHGLDFLPTEVYTIREVWLGD